MRNAIVILTKRELADFLAHESRNNVLHSKTLYYKLITILEWDDDEPRDIQPQDILELENQIAIDVDLLLTTLENKIKPD